MALHPLMAALKRVDLRAPGDEDLNRLFEGAASDGATPAERQILEGIRQRYQNGWDLATRTDFERRLGGLPPGPRGVRTNATGPDAEDLSSRMKTVWMAGYDSAEQASYVADMARLGAELGFNLMLQVPRWAPLAGVAAGLVRSTGLPVEALDQVVDLVPTDTYPSVWGEDNKILTNGDDRDRPVKVLVPPDISDRSLYKAEVFTQDEGYHRYYEGFQGAVDARNEPDAAVDAADGVGRRVERTATYIEGGNLLPGTTPDGGTYALVGRDTVIISAFHLEEIGAFAPDEVRRKRIAMERDGTLTEDLVVETGAKLQAAEDAAAGWWGAPEVDFDQAADFAAKIELTKEQLAKDIDLPADRLVVVTQPEFHIDMHMRPLAPGEVLVQHPAACIELIDEALRDPDLRRWEEVELQDMRRNAQRDLELMGPVYDRIIGELEAAGLIAVEAPGVFHSYNRQANFMNAIPGTTADGEQYFLTNASSIRPLERAFARFVEGLGVDRVEFLGADGGGRDSLSASEVSLEYSGGLDCREVNHAGTRRPRADLANLLRGIG